MREYVWDLFDDEEIVDDYTIIPLLRTWKVWDKELDRPWIEGLGHPHAAETPER